MSTLGALGFQLGIIPVISSGKMDSRTSLSSCWSSTPIAKLVRGTLVKCAVDAHSRQGS